MATIITSIDDLDFNITDVAEMQQPGSVLMVTPDYFSVEYVINPHMKNQVGMVDKVNARRQWETIYQSFERLGYNTLCIQGAKDLPDMVFSANQSLPGLTPDGQKKAVMSLMHADQRKAEVPFFEQWYRRHEYEVCYLDEEHIQQFEGMGDALWHPGRRLIWGGYGFRTDLKAYEQIAKIFEVPVIALELTSDYFYHLDTCLCLLNEKNVLIYPNAFTAESLEIIHQAFTHVIVADEKEAKELFACNAVCPDGQNVIIQQGCEKTNKKLQQAGFEIIPVETDEFLKSGGSVFCMKLMLW